jgi:uncharacterized membrane protein
LSKKNKGTGNPQSQSIGNPAYQPQFLPSSVSEQILNTPTVVHQQETIISGPLPAPDVIAGYEKVLPGAADRIIRMAENEQSNRFKYLNRVTVFQAGLTLIGQMFAFAVVLISVIEGVALIKAGKPPYGVSVIITSLVALVGSFAYGTHKAKPDQRKPANQKTNPN